MAGAPPFAHLHVHSEYSILDGACQVRPLVERVGELGMAHIGLTDHGTMAGTVELYQAARKAGVKPVLGMEAYVTPDHTVKLLDDGRRSETTHLTLLAADNDGWKNLMKLSSRACLEGMYYKPRIDYDMMAEHAKGLIVLTGCMASRTQRFIANGQLDQGREEIDRLAQIFGRDNLYVEFQDVGIDEQAQINHVLRDFQRDGGYQAVVTSDVHYLRHEDAIPHDALLCIQTKAKLHEPKGDGPGKRFGFSSDQFYLKSPEEMWERFSSLGYPADWLAASVEIAERCDVELTLGENLLPAYTDEHGNVVDDPDSYLRELCERGLRERYPQVTGELEERLNFELSTISRMGYSAYFLITWDWIAWARSQGIPIGPGRGSAAGSLVAYTLGITDVDPIRYDLLFERFLNPDRVSMPDIDTDVAQAGRGPCIRYLTDKYGADKVAQIATFGRMAPKAAVKDAARVMDLSVAIGEKVSQLIPEGPGQSFARNMAPGMDLRKAYDSDATVREVVDMAMPLEGMVRNTSIHAAAVVIGDRPLTEIVPLRAGDHGDEIVTQFAQGDVEALGLLKMDVLGLRNLDVLQKVVQFIEQSRGEHVDVSKLPLDDEKTFRMISAGDCIGVFQLESEGMQAAARLVKPTRFEDIVALVALYRPGPMAHIPTYAANKRNPDAIRYADARLEEILADTYGITIYQEQYMIIARKLAGFTPGQADELRKGIGKKLRPVLDKLKPQFLEGCANNGVDPKVAAALWDDAERAGDYSFNKSHALCYALIAYQTAYLKAHYPSEYMAALISSVMHTKDKVPFFVNGCAKMGIEVLPPDVNESYNDFAVQQSGAIRFGLSAVKGVGEQAVAAIVAAREERPFDSLFDFCRRVDKVHANKRVLEALIKAGAFDSTGASRKGMLDVLPQAMAIGQKAQEDSMSGQGDLFSMFAEDNGNGDAAGAAEDDAVAASDPPIPAGEFDLQERLEIEKEATGLYMSGHPLDEFREAIDTRTEHAIGALSQLSDKTPIVIGGMVSGFRSLVTKKGDPMAFCQLEGTDTETVRLVVLPKVFEVSREKLQGERRVVIVRGKVDAREGRCDVVADEVLTLDEAPQLTAVTVVAPEAQLRDERVIGELRRIFRNYPGDATVDIRVQTASGERLMRLGREWRVAIEPGLKDELRELLGASAVQ